MRALPLFLLCLFAPFVHAQSESSIARTFEPDRWYLMTLPTNTREEALSSGLGLLELTPEARLWAYGVTLPQGEYDSVLDGVRAYDLSNGQSFWFRHKGSQPIEVTFPTLPQTKSGPDGTCDGYEDCPPLFLTDAGWHTVGNPFTETIRANIDLMFIRDVGDAGDPCTETPCNVAAAINAGLIGPSLWGWTGQTYERMNGRAIEPLDGFWIKTRVDGVRMLFRSPFCERS